MASDRKDRSDKPANTRNANGGSDSWTARQDIQEPEGRMPPQAVEVEESVLGGMLIEHQAASIVLQLLKAEDFYKPAHRHIFSAIAKLFERDNPLDILTVENELRDQGLLEACGGSGYLTELTRSVSSAANIEYHCQIVAEKAIKRNLIHSCTEVIKQAYDTGSDPFELLDHAEQQIFELANEKSQITSKPLSEVMKKTLSYLEEIRGKKHGITGVPTGLDIDKLTAGWQPGDMIIIAARPSMGKTAFTLSMARNTALYPDQDKQGAVAIFSLEMSDQSLVQRLLTMEARVSAQNARTGRLKDDEFQRLIEAAGRLHTARIFIDDTPSLSLMELRSKCRRLKSEHGISIVVVDYLQLMTGFQNDRNTASREQEIATISRGLKALAKELDIPVIALSQLSRAVEQRGGDKRPQLSDLRESGSIEQDADVVCFLYRPEYYGIQTDEMGNSTAGVAELIVGKQRNGPTDIVRLHFMEDYARFDNLASANNTDYIGAGDLGTTTPDPLLGEGEEPEAQKGDSGKESGKDSGSGANRTGYTPTDEDSPF